MKKKLLIAALSALLLINTMSPLSMAFSDTDNSDYKSAITELTELGVISGFEDGTFKPEANVTRAEAAKMFAAAKGFTGKPTDYYFLNRRSGFSDFTSTHWAYPYAYYLMPEYYRMDENGNEIRAVRVIDGFEDGTFRPEDNITLVQFLKMAVCCMGDWGYYQEVGENGGYPDGYIYVAKKYGFSDGIDLSDINAYTTREQAAKILSNTINLPMITELMKIQVSNYREIIDKNYNGNIPRVTLKSMLQSGNWIAESMEDYIK